MTQYRMECYGNRGRGGHQTAQAPHDLLRGAAQRTVFKLDIDAVEVLQPNGDVLDVTIGQTLDIRMRTAQQILIEIEDSNVRTRAKLQLQRSGIAGDAAHLIIGADDRDAKRAGSRRRGSIEQTRPPVFG